MSELTETLQMLARQLGDRLTTYRRDRPFKLPRNYPSWDFLSTLALANEVIPIHQGFDQNATVHALLWQIWHRHTGPIYCLDLELLRQFQLTDAEGLGRIVPPDWQPSVPVMLLALPNGAIKTPGGAEVAYLLIGCETSAQPFDLMRFPGPRIRRLVVGACDSTGTVWGNTSELTSDGGLGFADIDTGSSALTPTERAWVRDLAALATQSIMAIAYLPELLSEGAPPTPPPKGKRGVVPKVKGSKNLYPRWIGKDFKPAQPNGRSPGASPGGGHHASPATHWRRGHWRNQPHGPGRQMQRPIWIQPTLINAE